MATSTCHCDKALHNRYASDFYQYVSHDFFWVHVTIFLILFSDFSLFLTKFLANKTYKKSMTKRLKKLKTIKNNNENTMETDVPGYVL